MSRKISASELSKHNQTSDAWIAIDGTIWDVTEFAPKHPGGAEIVNQYIGHDATEAYNEVHSSALVASHLSTSKRIGILDPTTVTSEWKDRLAPTLESTPEQNETERPPLESILNMYDFEAAAEKSLSPKSWAFQSCAANDCLTRDANVAIWRRVWFRPRVLRGVRDVDTSSTVLGKHYSMPMFSAPAALAKLAHPDGEKAMARALAKKGTTIIICNNASFSFWEIADELPRADYPVFYQLYVNKDRAVTEKLVRDVSGHRGLQAIIVTVDLPVVGKREADERVKIDANYKQPKSFQSKALAKDKKGAGLARATGSFIDDNLQWKDIAWLQSLTHVPIFLKGIQCASDAQRALQYGCKGIYISNHGGRAADTAQPSLVTLLEINAVCPEVLEKLEVFIDGGIRRGSDLVKAICLGASAVTMGRPFLYSVGYGQEGVEHAVEIFEDEVRTCLQHIGVTRLEDLGPELVNTGDIDGLVSRQEGHTYAKKIVRARL